MKNKIQQVRLVPEFKKFITASATGRRLMPSGKRLRKGTIRQYEIVFKLLTEFECAQAAPIRIMLLHRSPLREMKKEKNYWVRFVKQFSYFLYKKKIATINM